MTETSLIPLDIPSLLKQFGLRPSKGLGQNFLQDEQALQAIVASADISPDDDVLEIGPGLGSLTRHLAQAAHRVVSVELDKTLFPALESIISPYHNVRLLQGDILRMDPGDLMNTPDYLVVANIPYYLTSALLRHLLERSLHPRRLVLTMQEEVAERICASPGKMSLLSLSVQIYGTPSIQTRIPAEAFFPAPKVDSAVLRVEIMPEPVIPAPLQNTFFKLIKAGFSQRRKTLRNSLSGGLGISPASAEKMLSATGIDPMRRAETLSLEEWHKLCKAELSKDVSSD